jgi:hypothetical protein
MITFDSRRILIEIEEEKQAPPMPSGRRIEACRRHFEAIKEHTWKQSLEEQQRELRAFLAR